MARAANGSVVSSSCCCADYLLWYTFDMIFEYVRNSRTRQFLKADGLTKGWCTDKDTWHYGITYAVANQIAQDGLWSCLPCHLPSRSPGNTQHSEMMTRVLVHLEAEFIVSSSFPSHADLCTDNANDQSLNPSRKENIRCAMSPWIGYAWVRMQVDALMEIQELSGASSRFTHGLNMWWPVATNMGSVRWPYVHEEQASIPASEVEEHAWFLFLSILFYIYLIFIYVFFPCRETQSGQRWGPAMLAPSPAVNPVVPFLEISSENVVSTPTLAI